MLASATLYAVTVRLMYQHMLLSSSSLRRIDFSLLPNSCKQCNAPADFPRQPEFDHTPPAEHSTPKPGVVCIGHGCFATGAVPNLATPESGVL